MSRQAASTFTEMTRIKAIFEGMREDLEMAELSAVSNFSFKKIVGNRLFVTWICETEDYESALTDCMEKVNLDSLFRVELVSMG